MNYSIRYTFNLADVSVGDLMYDTLHSVMVKVAYVAHKFDGSKQLCLEDTSNGVLFVVGISKNGKLPNLKNTDKPQFSMLLKFNEYYYCGGTLTYKGPYWGIQTNPLDLTQPYYGTFNRTNSTSTATISSTRNSSVLLNDATNTSTSLNSNLEPTVLHLASGTLSSTSNLSDVYASSLDEKNKNISILAPAGTSSNYSSFNSEIPFVSSILSEEKNK